MTSPDKTSTLKNTNLYKGILTLVCIELDKKMDEELRNKHLEKVRAEWTKELKKYGQKINAMMIESTRGDCPQVFKILLMKVIVDFSCDNFKKKNKKDYKEAQKLIEKFVGSAGALRSLTKEEYEAKFGPVEER